MKFLKLRDVAIVSSRCCNAELWIASAKIRHQTRPIRTMAGDGIRWTVIMRHIMLKK